MAKVYSKRRMIAAPDEVDGRGAGVSETTKPKQVYSKRQSGVKRTRNDESDDLFNRDDNTRVEHKVDIIGVELKGFSKPLLKEPQKAEVYTKQRKSSKRTRNDELDVSVPETTNQMEVYPKRRTSIDRTRNDEITSASVALPKHETGRSPLLPEYYPNEDLFICDVLDAIPKDDMASMEHPIFTLSTRPDMREIHYEHNGITVDIWPSRLGMATIHDKDILIYCVSQLVAKMNKNEPLGRTLKLKPYNLLAWSNRQTSGDGYARMINALDRLSGTRIKTNISADDQEFANGFGLITEYQVIKNNKTGQMLEVKITLSDWLFRMVQGKSVLTLHRNYFRLRKPLERRIYELARKHCGSQPQWKISTEVLQKKTGSYGNIRQFRQSIRELVQTNHLPDYTVEFDGVNVTFFKREYLARLSASSPIPFVDNDGMHDAKLAAPGYDVHALYQEWGEWWNDSGCPELRDANSAFIGFCRRKHTSNPIR